MRGVAAFLEVGEGELLAARHVGVLVLVDDAAAGILDFDGDVALAGRGLVVLVEAADRQADGALFEGRLVLVERGARGARQGDEGVVDDVLADLVGVCAIVAAGAAGVALGGRALIVDFPGRGAGRAVLVLADGGGTAAAPFLFGGGIDAGLVQHVLVGADAHVGGGGGQVRAVGLNDLLEGDVVLVALLVDVGDVDRRVVVLGRVDVDHVGGVVPGPRGAGGRDDVTGPAGRQRVAAAALDAGDAVGVDEHGGAGLQHGLERHGAAIPVAVVGDPRVMHEHDRLQGAHVLVDLAGRETEGAGECGALIRHGVQVGDQPFDVADGHVAAAAVELFHAAADVARHRGAGDLDDFVLLHRGDGFGERRGAGVVGGDVGHRGDVRRIPGPPARRGDADARQHGGENDCEADPHEGRDALLAGRRLLRVSVRTTVPWVLGRSLARELGRHCASPGDVPVRLTAPGRHLLSPSP